MYQFRSLAPTIEVDDKLVFLRADLNVSLNHLASHPQRLQALQPTLDMLLLRGARVLLASHIGRPKEREEKLSTRHLLPWFLKNGYAITYASEPEIAYRLLEEGKYELVLLENLRFWPEEKAGDIGFAHRLKGHANIYINDAFATLHRNDTSIALLPTLFDADHKTIGLLIEKEFKGLQPLLDNPATPYVVFLGGGKVEDKLPLIEGLLDYATTIVLCPALVFTFLTAQKKEVGASLIAPEQQDTARHIMQKAAQKKVNLIFPVDYLVADHTFDGPLSLIDAHEFQPRHVGISIGPKMVAQLVPIIEAAHTIFFNAAMGTLERPETVTYTGQLLKLIVQSPAYTVIGGGDSVAAAQFFNFAGQASFCSTGGGATLYLISGNKLPGLEALLPQ